MNEPAGERSGVTQREADILGRQFNSALTNTTAYGADHPVTGRTYATFLDSLAPALEHSESVTLMFDRGSLFIEDMPLDGKFNSRRISTIFRAIGLQSIRFGRGIDANALARFMAVLSNHDQYDDIDAVRDALQADGISAIRVNHVVMRKFSEDEAVISRDGLSDLTDLAEQAVAPGAGGGRTGGGSLAGELMERVEQVFTMRDLVDRPANLTGQVLSASRAGSGKEDVVEQIRSLRREVTSAGASDVSMSDVMEALAEVRGELSSALASQDEIARFLAENGSDVLDEVDRLTYETVLSIMVEEYRNGTTSAKRLAQIMRRIMPDSRDIKRFVPMLKQGLLDEGMPLDEYVRFVNELGEELKSDALVSALERGSESVGLSVDEIVGEIRKDPGEAARLLVLAAEMRHAGGDEARLSSVLADYIERASGEMVSEDEQAQGGHVAVREALRNTQKELVQNLCTQGVSESIGARIRSDLAERVDESVEQVRARRLGKLVRASADVDETEVVNALEHFVSRTSELETLSETIRVELESIGYSEEVINRIYAQTERRLRGRSRLELLPNGMLEPNVLAYLLEREIAGSRRHGTYFSCVLLMVARIREDEEDAAWRSVQPAEVEQIIPQVFAALPPHVRDVDLLGSLGSKSRNIPLVLLTMTRDEGAAIVRERMIEALNAEPYDLDDCRVRIRTIGVSGSFSANETPDRKSYLKALQARLANELVSSLRRAPDQQGAQDRVEH
jgi:hypothetical protein